ncbi:MULTISPECIES: hypothetical protein [unclassified Pseudomonas]|jgi:hypothetical protein|uniref:hypothetical protein n=1 Tax=unclassified Pseudomonas TaxID=196821 RepID=UPI0012FEC5F6|nr:MULTISPECIES: hypothetical protein [unclassified Pseudomonas]
MSKGFSLVFIDAEGIRPGFEEMSDALIGSVAEPLSSLLNAHKKGRCKRSGQGKTLDQGATNQRQ